MFTQSAESPGLQPSIALTKHGGTVFWRSTKDQKIKSVLSYIEFKASLSYKFSKNK